MKSIWREYGLIAILIIVSVTGYFLYGKHKDDLVAFSLDTIGTRLEAMVDDPVARDRLAVAFDAFRERVESREVDPVDVEHVAANLLNLTTSGERLAADDIDMVVDLWEPRAAEIPRPPKPTAEEWNRRALRVNEAISVAEKALVSIPRDSLRGHLFRFATNDRGAIRVVVEDDVSAFVMLDSVDRHARLSQRTIQMGIFADIDTMKLKLEAMKVVPRMLEPQRPSEIESQ